MLAEKFASGWKRGHQKEFSQSISKICYWSIDKFSTTKQQVEATGRIDLSKEQLNDTVKGERNGASTKMIITFSEQLWHLSNSLKGVLKEEELQKRKDNLIVQPYTREICELLLKIAEEPLLYQQ